jgi:hypothetical protein
MLGWLLRRPRCPLELWEKTWTEVRMRWLADRFGIQRLRQAEVLLPGDPSFPEPYHGTVEDTRLMMDRLCACMDLDPTRLELKVMPDVCMPDAAGLYQRPRPRRRAVIRVAESQLADPSALAATLAHELAHELLLGGGLLDESVYDHEWVTDLLPVYLGIGVFAANNTLREQSGQDGQWSWWSMGRQGYLPSRMFGYALALFAFLRDESSPAWAAHLRLDAASALGDGLRYLLRTGDSLFHPDTVKEPRHEPTADEVVAQLRDRNPSRRLAALWDVRDYKLTTPECLEAVLACLGEEAPVAGDAARALAVFGPAAAPALPRLREALWAPDDDTRVEAACTLGTLRLQPEATVPELCGLLREPVRAVFNAAAWALAEFGVRADTTAARRLMAALEVSLVECEYATVEVVGRALLAVAASQEQCVREHFAGRDAELRRRALEALAGLRSTPSDKESSPKPDE